MAGSVTLIVAAYNAGTTIARAIVSALAQEDAAEVVVVDDASTDDTVARARSADDGSGRLRILTQPRNAGPAAARNRAIAESTSPWIGVLDADDFMQTGRLHGLLAASESHDLIADDMWKVDEAAIDGPRRLLLGEGLPRDIGLYEFINSNIPRRGKTRGELGFIKPLIRRDFLDRHRLRYREDLRLGEDYEFYARILAAGGRLRILSAQGYVSVVRANSLSGRHRIEDLRHLRDCDEDLLRLPNLTSRDRDALRRHAISTDCRLQWRLLIEAVKARDLRAAFACFQRPWPVKLSLLRQLGEQAVLRSLGKCS